MGHQVGMAKVVRTLILNIPLQDGAPKIAKLPETR